MACRQPFLRRFPLSIHLSCSFGPLFGFQEADLDRQRPTIPLIRPAPTSVVQCPHVLVLPQRHRSCVEPLQPLCCYAPSHLRLVAIPSRTIPPGRTRRNLTHRRRQSLRKTSRYTCAGTLGRTATMLRHMIEVLQEHLGARTRAQRAEPTARTSSLKDTARTHRYSGTAMGNK